MTIQYNANPSAQSPIASPPPEEKTKNERKSINNDLSKEITGDYASRSSLGYYNFNLNDYNSSRNESRVDLYQGRIIEQDPSTAHFKATLTKSFFVNKEPVSAALKANKGILRQTQQKLAQHPIDKKKVKHRKPVLARSFDTNRIRELQANANQGDCPHTQR